MTHQVEEVMPLEYHFTKKLPIASVDRMLPNEQYA